MIYAKADSRWGGADLTVVSLELLTVLGAGPLALWICTMIAKRDPMASFWMVVLATGELYGGLFYPSSSSFFLPIKRNSFMLKMSCNRIHDLRPRMANRQPKSRRQ
jgi:hypothetical protein